LVEFGQERTQVRSKKFRYNNVPKQRLNASGVVNERCKKSIRTVVLSTVDERGRPILDVVWRRVVVAKGVIDSIPEIGICHQRELNLFAQVVVSIAAFDSFA
jgi:hypothetical protein